MASIAGHDSAQLSLWNDGTGLGLSDCELQSISALIENECGFYLGVEKRTFLESRLRKRMDELGLKVARDYYDLLRNEGKRELELPTLLDRMMVCETSFFRNMAQFELLTEVVLPGLLNGKERTGSRLIRLWSAGCSTGQEPYSLVMCLDEALSDCGDWTIRVLASDLSFTALERAESGIYRRDQVGGMGAEYLENYFTEDDRSYHIKDFVRREVIFNYHNLKHDNGLRGLDVIFCRNVLIYFGVEQQRRVIEQLTRCLAPGGYLFLGHAESLQGLSSRFTMVHRNKGIAYRLDG